MSKRPPTEWDDISAAVYAALRSPSEAVWGGVARQIILWRGFNKPTGRELHAHLRRTEYGVPAWLEAIIPNTDHVPAKGDVVAAILNAAADAIEEGRE